MKSVPNWISYPHEVSWNFSQLLPNCFELFSSGSIFNSKNHYCGVPPISLSLSPHRARLSGCRFRVAATRPCYPLKALADSASLLSEPRHHLAVGAPPDRACPNDAVSTVRARLTAGSRPAPPPVRPSRCRLPASPHHRVLLRSRLPPLTTLSPFVQELAARSRPITGATTASAVATPSTVSGAPSTPLLPFPLGTPTPELPLLSHPDAGHRRSPEHPPHRRTSPSSGFSTLPIGKKLG
jgi:hypothetical protein